MENLASYITKSTKHCSLTKDLKYINFNFKSNNTYKVVSTIALENNLWPEEIPDHFACIYLIVSRLWDNKYSNYDEMHDIYLICSHYGYSSLASSKLVREIILGIHKNESIFQIYELCKKL